MANAESVNAAQLERVVGLFDFSTPLPPDEAGRVSALSAWVERDMTQRRATPAARQGYFSVSSPEDRRDAAGRILEQEERLAAVSHSVKTLAFDVNDRLQPRGGLAHYLALAGLISAGLSGDTQALGALRWLGVDGATCQANYDGFLAAGESRASAAARVFIAEAGAVQLDNHLAPGRGARRVTNYAPTSPPGWRGAADTATGVSRSGSAASRS